MSSLATVARDLVLQSPEVTRFPSLRRSTCLFSQSQIADAVYFVDDGLVKLTRTNHQNGRIILAIFGAGSALGEEGVGVDSKSTYYAEAEVLTQATVYRIPRELITQKLATQPEFALAFIEAITLQKRVFAEKVELLCLHDVEYRILHYLAEISSLLKAPPSGGAYQLPITQLELADLIGATRETTSTMLNQLERRGLLQLSRRMLTIPSPEGLRAAALARTQSNGTGVGRPTVV